MTNFYELGQQAFNNGESRNPFSNALIQQLIDQDPRVGAATKQMKQFTKGYDAESFKVMWEELNQLKGAEA